jgi:hypothetical protein
MNAVLILQLITLAVAAAGPVLAYRYARKLSSTKNWQGWMDALRQDIAECIALWSETTTLYNMAASLKNADARLAAINAQREKMYLLAVVIYRIRLRLRPGDPMHDRLKVAIKALGEGRAEKDKIVHLREEVLSAAEAIIQQVWQRIQGVDAER